MPRGFKKDGSFAGIVFKKGEKAKNWNGFKKGCKWPKDKKRNSGVYDHFKIKGIHPKTEFKKGNHTKTEFKKGGKHPNWNGGSSFLPYPIDWTKTLRQSIRERDHYVCQIGKEIQGEITFDIHHIDYDKKNLNPENLITLCRNCHAKTNQNRNYWINYFQEPK